MKNHFMLLCTKGVGNNQRVQTLSIVVIFYAFCDCILKYCGGH